MQRLYPLYDFGSFPIFNTIVALGFLLASVLLNYNLNKINDTKTRKDNIIIYLGLSFIFGIAISNIANWFMFPDLQNQNIIYKIKHAGFTFYFGLLTFLISIYVFLKFFNYDASLYLNEIIPSITLFHFIGRIACLLGGCCYGKILNLTLYSFTIERYPTRELSIFFLLFLTIIFQIFLKKNRLFIYLTVYPIYRFSIEFARGDNRGHLFTKILSPSQEISIIILLFVLLFFLYGHFKKYFIIK